MYFIIYYPSLSLASKLCERENEVYVLITVALLPRIYYVLNKYLLSERVSEN